MNKLKDFILYEVESHEQIREGLEAIIKKRDNFIANLEETLSVPRQHYKFIERLTTEETIKQKDEILKRMSTDMGIPYENLISKMYEKTAREAAQKEIDKAFAESGGEDDDPGAGAKSSPDKKKDAKKLANSASVAPVSK